MRKDFWEVTSVCLLGELGLRIAHTLMPIWTKGVIPIAGDDIKQTGLFLMVAVVWFGTARHFERPSQPNAVLERKSHRGDYWEVVGVAFLFDLLLRIVHAILPSSFDGFLPISGDDVRQTSLVLMMTVVGFGIFRYFRLPISDDPEPISQPQASQRARLPEFKAVSAPLIAAERKVPLDLPRFLAPKNPNASRISTKLQ